MTVKTYSATFVLPIEGKILVNSERKYYKLMHHLIRHGVEFPSSGASISGLLKKEKIGIIWRKSKKTIHETNCKCVCHLKRVGITTYDNPYFNELTSDIKQYKFKDLFPYDKKTNIPYTEKTH